MVRAENPRAVIGSNGGPPLDDDDKAPPTPEEARIVYAAIAYIQFKRPGLDDFMEKKKGKVKLGWRLLVLNMLRDRVRQSSIKQLLKFNRKTVGENQQRADSWAELDEEFDALLSDLRAAVIADYHVDAPALEAKLKAFVLADPDLQRLEEQKRASLAAAEEAEAAAERHEAKKREAKRAEKMKVSPLTKAALKNVPDADAIQARYKGPAVIAKKISDEAVSVIAALLTSAEGRKPASALNASGLKECAKLGITRLAEPSQPKGAPPVADPRHGITAFGQLVGAQALEQGRIKKKKRKKNDEEGDED